MLKFRVVNLTDAFRSAIFEENMLKQRSILQAAINEIGEQNIRYITSSAGAGGGANPTFTIFYHEDDPA